MKRLILILTIALSALCSHAETLLESCENIPGITSVYISKTMLSLASGLDMHANGIDLGMLISKLDNLVILNADGKKAKMLRDKATKSFKNQSYEKLMTVRNDGQTVDALVRELGKSRYEYVLYVCEDESASVIILNGTFTLDEIIAATRVAR